MPFTVRHYRLRADDGAVLAEVSDNHQTVNHIPFDEPIECDHLRLELIESHSDTPAALFALQCYA